MRCVSELCLLAHARRFFSVLHGSALMKSPEQLDEKLQEYRTYLQCLARGHLDATLQAKIDLSALVQDTLLEAHRSWAKLAGRSAGEQAAWLRRTLAHNL